MTDNKPEDEAEHRVVPMRPGIRIPSEASDPNPVEGLQKYERTDEPDDYRHRMIVNVVAFGALALLIFGGLWIADQMASMRKSQDCVLSGRRNCSLPPSAQ
ncbi:MAG: hypothetical protein AB7K04_13180 [Pseudorhodoplanes sp.]